MEPSAAAASGTVGSTARRAGTPGHAAGAGVLTGNGLTDPVGVDPDDAFFAWTVQASGRAPVPVGDGVPHRGPPHRPGAAPVVVGQRLQ